jgi:hypothetical protein
MNWKRFRRKRLRPNRGAIPAHPGGSLENYEELIQDSRCSGRGLKRGLPKYKYTALLLYDMFGHAFINDNI